MLQAPRIWLLLVPLSAIALGAAVANTLSVPARVFVPNLLAVLVGGAIALMLPRAGPGPRAWVLRWMPRLAFLALLATLPSPGIDHVHRWISLGPVRLHASAAFLPWILGGLASPSARARASCLVLTLGAQLVHLMQPDAAQATALALGLLPLLMGGTLVRRGTGLILAGVFLLLAAATWTRADPLLPVDHVERVLVLAFSRGALWILAAGVAEGLLFLPLLLALGRPCTAPAGWSLGFTLYFATTLGVTFQGNFPVPVMGAGAGPVLGWYTLVAMLFAARPTPGISEDAVHPGPGERPSTSNGADARRFDIPKQAGIRQGLGRSPGGGRMRKSISGSLLAMALLAVVCGTPIEQEVGPDLATQKAPFPDCSGSPDSLITYWSDALVLLGQMQEGL